jgi:hypothetical protein
MNGNAIRLINENAVGRGIFWTVWIPRMLFEGVA